MKVYAQLQTQHIDTLGMLALQAFVGLLGISLMGSKGDFHNRCAVPLIINGGTANATFTYEPVSDEQNTCVAYTLGLTSAENGAMANSF
jgi:hypothetical protein